MNMNIELTEQQEKFLKLFAKNQYSGSKDNLSTEKPIHTVQTRRQACVKEGYGDKTVYIVRDWDNQEFETPEELVREYYKYNDDECPIEIIPYDEACIAPDFKDTEGEECYVFDVESYFEAYGILDCDLWEEHEISYYYEDVAFFFTLESAKDYMRYQSHNLNEPRTYTKGGGYNNCGEYHHFWDLLMSMGVQLNEECGA